GRGGVLSGGRASTASAGGVVGWGRRGTARLGREMGRGRRQPRESRRRRRCVGGSSRDTREVGTGTVLPVAGPGRESPAGVRVSALLRSRRDRGLGRRRARPAARGTLATGADRRGRGPLLRPR